MKVSESVKMFFSKYKKALEDKGVKIVFSDEQKMTTAVLADGTEISTPAEAWAEGVDVLGADGQPLATGEYQLTSGETLVIEDGKVKSILPAGYPETEMSAEETAEALEVVAAEQEALIETLIEEKENLEASIQEKEKQLQTMSSQIEDLKKQVAKLAKLPAAFSTKEERNDAKPEQKTKGQEIIERLEKKQAIFGAQGE